jgi:hypothetical protein
VSTYALPSRLVKRVFADLKFKTKSAAPAGKSDSVRNL